MNNSTRVMLGCLATTLALACAAVGPSAATSVWFDPARSATAPFADGELRTASTADELSRQQGSRPPASEHWDDARLKASNDKGWADWIAQQRQQLGAWVLARLERPELVGGWLHDYIDPASGVRQVWTSQTPRPVPRANDPAAQRLERAWVAYMREYNIARMLDAARLYRLVGDEQYAEWAAGQLDLYAENYERWPLRTDVGRGRMFAHGLDEATNVFALLDVARLLGGYAGPHRVTMWRQGLFYPIALNLKTVPSPLSNIGLWQAAAIAAVAMRFDDASLLAYARDGANGIAETLRQGVTRDNLWIEGTFSYNAYVLDALDRLLVAAAIEGQAGAFHEEAMLARRLLFAPLDYRFEDGSLPTPGDGTVGLQAQPEWLHFKLYRSVPTAVGLRRAAVVRSWDTLLDPPPALVAAVAPPPAVMSRLFAANRMAVLKAGPWQAFIRYGQVVRNHAQFEALNYELADGPTKLSAGVGTVSYAARHHLDYFTQAAAHNVPLIDGQGQADLPGSADVTGFSAAEDRLLVSFPRYRADAAVERAWRVTDRGFVERTRIVAQSGSLAPRRLGSAFHTTCNVATGALQVTGRPLGPPSTTATKYWTDSREFAASGQWSVTLECLGSRKYTLTVSGPAEQRIIVATVPSAPLPATRTVIYFDTLGTEADFELGVNRLGASAR